MASPTYALQPNPKWYLVNNIGLPLAPNGYIFTYSSSNKSLPKATYQDASGQNAWPNPIPIDANGTVGPIFWEYDPENPSETYYITVNASLNPNDIVWDFDGLSGASGGGGSVVTTAFDLENFIINNTFYRNIGTVSPVPLFKKVAASAHTGLAQTSSNRGPDICFIKNNTNASDVISFPSFNGVARLNGDVTPPHYFNYTCNNTFESETYKYLQFPITSNVQALAGQLVSITLWASLGGVGSDQIKLSLKQFFGDGSTADTEVPTQVANITLTSTWTKYGPYKVVIPSVSSKTLGNCRNDGLFFQISFPLGVPCNINLTKPALYLGDIAPSEDFHTNDMVETIFNSHRTADVRISLNDFYPFGWVLMNDGTIGSPTSGATTRADYDTFPLYNQIWTAVSQAWAPVTGGRGASAVLDYTANKPIALTKALGRVLAGATPATFSHTFTVDKEVSTTILNVSSTTDMTTGAPLRLTTTETLPMGLYTGVTYYAIVVDATKIKLAYTYELALAGTAIVFSTNGTGTHTLANAMYEIGTYAGEDQHIQTVEELAPHNHRLGMTLNNIADAGGNVLSTDADTFVTQTTGLGKPFNIIQKTSYMNIYMKL